MHNDHNLLFGVVALRESLIDATQFAEACRRWSDRPQIPLGELLVELGWILPSDKKRLDQIVELGGPLTESATLF
ncbi:MAG: hypothetical protein AB7K24_11905, partial [Gemmataceae bacterium]